MSESSSQIDELRDQLDVLKSIYDSPLSYLTQFFFNLKNDVANAFTLKLETSEEPSAKAKLNENWNEINAKIGAFEAECKQKLAPVELDEEKMSLIEMKLESYNEDLYAEINDLIYDETYKIEKILFLNKTMVFLDRTRISLISDDHSSANSLSFNQNVSDDSNESFNEDVNLFYYMNSKTTCGKLIYITNQYFGKRTLPILKYGTDCNQDRLTSEIIKCMELRKRMEKSLTKTQIDEIALDMPHMNKLDFSFYELKQIEPTIFKSSFTRLRWINLSDNQLTYLDKDIFVDLADLRSISLASNKLTSIHPNTFRSNKKLNEINLSDNELEHVDSALFHGLIRLELIYLNKNKLKRIDANLFKGLNELKWLYLNNNRIESIDSQTFAGLTKLIEINLSENRLACIEADTFADQIDLEDLNLRFNKLKQISPNLFHKLNKITSIDVSNNELARVDAIQFRGLDELTFLNLSSNKIELFDENLFSNLTKIKSIDLSYNINSNSSTCYNGGSDNFNYLNTYFSNLPIKW